MTTLTRNDRTDSLTKTLSPALRSTAATARAVGTSVRRHQDIAYVVLGTVAFVIIVGLIGVFLLSS
jgi:hypothetical protein